MVDIWASEFGRMSAERRTAFLYLANHILQESRKKGREYVEEFYRVLPKIISAAARSSDEKLRTATKRLLDIWDERKVFGSNHIKPLRDAWAKGAAGGSTPGGLERAPSSSGRGEAAGGSVGAEADAAKRKLAALGSLADVMSEVAGCAARSSELGSKASALQEVREGGRAKRVCGVAGGRSEGRSEGGARTTWVMAVTAAGLTLHKIGMLAVAAARFLAGLASSQRH